MSRPAPSGGRAATIARLAGELASLAERIKSAPHNAGVPEIVVVRLVAQWMGHR